MKKRISFVSEGPKMHSFYKYISETPFWSLNMQYMYADYIY